MRVLLTVSAFALATGCSDTPAGPPDAGTVAQEAGTAAARPDAATADATASESGGTALSDSQAQLAELYATYGGREAFPAEHVLAVEALFAAEDAVAAGDLTRAREQVESVFSGAWPRGDRRWSLASNGGTRGSNIGHPVAYYALRMLEQVVALDGRPSTGRLQMTAVVAPCARVRRPVYPDGGAEVVDLNLDRSILAQDARRLQLATRLFRRWVQAITGGLEVELVVHELSVCANTDFHDQGNVVIIAPETAPLIEAVPQSIARNTDFWWVITPSGLPPTGRDRNIYFITGGMGRYGTGLPMFISDDKWFVEKPEHMGTGVWTEAEVRAYHPQWFQHEFMHHLYRTWPEYRLEETGHQWFDRTTWPGDFVGIHEPDYYAESITKRLLMSTPTLAEGLTVSALASAGELPLSAFVGNFERTPVQNDWHRVQVEQNGEGLRWRNAAGVSWGLELRAQALFTEPDCPYGVMEVPIEAADGRVTTLWFNGEAYRRSAL